MSGRLFDFAKHQGFKILVDDGIIRAIGVPCLLSKGRVATCTIEKSFEPVTGKPTGQIGNAIHAVRIVPHSDEDHDGNVYGADGKPMERRIGGDGRSWSEISIRKGGQDFPEDDASVQDLLYRYTKQFVGAVYAVNSDGRADSTNWESPFNIPDTFEGRIGIGPMQDRIRHQQILIVGLGGTGSYILDLMSKTPVSSIHLLDDDILDWHNFMRAPGAPSVEEIERVRSSELNKVDYFEFTYAPFRTGIHSHVNRLTDSYNFANFLSENPIDIAFVSIHQLPDSDSPRQDEVYSELSDAKIPFIDSGISLTLNNEHEVEGSITTSSYLAGSNNWQNAIPNAKLCGDHIGYPNIQLPEVNALAASLAVMEWRRLTQQYLSESSSFLHKFRIEKPRLVFGD